MAWIELHQSLSNHRKILRLKNLLKIEAPHAMGLVCNLWLWAVDNAPDGDLTAFSAEEIAEVCGYKRDAKTFLKKLVEAGFIDRQGKKKIIHDWDDYAGKLVEAREIRRQQDRTRQAKRRAKLKETASEKEISECSEPPEEDVTQRHACVTRDNSVSHAHIQYSTVPNSISGGDDACACAREDLLVAEEEEPNEDGNTYQLNCTLDEISKLPENVKSKFYSTIDKLYASFWKRTPTDFEYAQIYNMIRCLHFTKADGFKELQMTEDDIYLLSSAFESSAQANKCFVLYLKGVYKNYKQRSIFNQDSLIDYELKRAGVC